MEKRHLADAIHFERMNSTEIRDNFLIEDLFVPGELKMVYCFTDRAVAGGVVPGKKPIALEPDKDMATEYFAKRREIGLINIGSKGAVTVDGKQYDLNNREALYVGRGGKDIRLESSDSKKPAQFYFVSYPAHKEYPTTAAKIEDAETVQLGSEEKSNKRTIYKYIHPAGIQSCQLVMGLTELAEGNVWNTMPAHTHQRRSEVYMYFDIDSDSLVFHYMGKPQETRHIVVREKQAVLSPIWSIHSGAGLSRYSFIWAMGGENQDFDDMQAFSLDDMK